MAISWVIFSLIRLVLLGGVVLLFVAPFRPVTRARLERFARRQQLPITPGNGPLVLDYLATTRRWRGYGLALSVVLTVAVTATIGSRGGLDFDWAFVGWFAGAVVAEWRVTGPVAAGTVRGALLTRRRAADYTGARVMALATAVWAVVGVGAIAGVAVGHARIAALLLLAAGSAVAAVITLAGRRVLDRPQPVSEPGLVAADDALRARSLRVLAGCAMAIGGYLATVLGAALLPGADRHGLTALIALVGGVALPILGVTTAVAPRSVPVRYGATA